MLIKEILIYNSSSFNPNKGGLFSSLFCDGRQLLGVKLTLFPACLNLVII